MRCEHINLILKQDFILERKEDMKKEGRSLTGSGGRACFDFLHAPNPLLIETKTKEYDDLARRMTAGSRQVDILRRRKRKWKSHLEHQDQLLERNQKIRSQCL